MKHLHVLALPCLMAALLLSGCNQKDADAYVGEQITSLKGKDTDTYSDFLQSGIDESNQQYVLQFPDKLKESYIQLLKTSLQSVQFEVANAKEKKNNIYEVEVSFNPIDIQKTLKSANASLISKTTAETLEEAGKDIFKQDLKIIKDTPKYSDEITTTIEVKKKGDNFSIDRKSLKALLDQALLNDMEPYTSLCELYDAKDFLTAYLDASFKGEITQFAKHTDRTKEEALSWYEGDVFSAPDDLSSAYKERYTLALKNILKQSRYTVHVPRKEQGLMNYTISVTTTPNNSLVTAYQEFESGTYYSIDEASHALVEKLEHYAASPVYGDETTTDISLNGHTLLDSGNEDSELQKLGTIICPMPE